MAKKPTKTIKEWEESLTALLEKNEFNELIQEAKTAIEEYPHEDFGYFLLGFAQLTLGHHEAAIEKFDKAIELDPTTSIVFTYRAFSKQFLDWQELAIEDYDKAIGLAPHETINYLCRGKAKYELEYYEDAIIDFGKAIELEPDFFEAYLNRGNAERALGRPEEAIRDYDKAIKLQPSNPVAYNQRGGMKCVLGRNKDAIADFTKVIELLPDSLEAYNNRANVRSIIGLEEAAIADYNKAIEANPGEAKVYVNRGVAKHSLGSYEDAIKDFDKALKLDPNSASAYNNRGNAKDAVGQYEEAIIDYNKAIDLDPNNPKYFHNRAIVVGKMEAEIATKEITQTYENRLAAFTEPQKIIGFHDKRIIQSSLRLYGVDIYREQNEGEDIKEDLGITAGQIIKYGFWFLRYRLNYPTLYLFILWAITLIIFYCLDFLTNCNAQYPYFCSVLLFFLSSLILSVPLIIWIRKNYTEKDKSKGNENTTPEAPFLGSINRGYMGYAERASSRYPYIILLIWAVISFLFLRYYFKSSSGLPDDLRIQDVLLFATTLYITTSPFRFNVNYLIRQADEELIRLDSYIRERNMMLFWNVQRQDTNEANKAHLTAKMFDHLDKNSAAEISLQMMKSRKFNWRLNQNKKECDKADDDNNKRDQTAELVDLLRAIKNLTPPKAE